MKRKFTIASILLSAFYAAAHGQANNPVNGNIAAKLKTYLTAHISEKVYLHFDKPYYAAGDTLYFKAYITLGGKHEPSNLSGVLHANLINTHNNIDQSIKLQIKNGMAWGDFALPDSLPAGNYHIRAYTKWMLNSGDDAYYDQTIAIGSSLNNKVPESGSSAILLAKGKPDVQFFPEGGDLVAGIASKVAFKVIGASGLGIAVNGTVTDDAAKTIAQISTTHNGMGSLMLNPEPGRTYLAKLNYADGTNGLVALPKAALKGIVLSVNNDSLSKATVRIVAERAYFEENKSKVFSLLIYSGGSVKSVPCTLDSAVITLDILKRHLPTGVATVTLFSPAGEPLCERLFFVQNYDRLAIGVTSDKTTYAKREHVNIKLNIKNRADSAIAGHFSVAVVDESKVKTEENAERTILTDLLLTSDLKGYVEQPNYYFIDPTEKTNSDLDLVMLTNGYRKFEWKQVLQDTYPALAYQPEKGLEIAGVAKNAFGMPLKKGTVSLIVLHGAVVSRPTDDKGRFSFDDLLFTDSAKFILQAVNAKGKNSTTLIYNKASEQLPVNLTAGPGSGDAEQPIKDYLVNSKEQHEEAMKYGMVKSIQLKEVKIKEIRKNKLDDIYPSSNLGGPGHADHVIHRQQIANLGGMLSERINGMFGMVINGGSVKYHNSYLKLVVDGTINSLTNINIINPNDVETIEILTGANSVIYGIAGGDGVLVITTRQGGQNSNDIQAVGILPITAYGFYKAREFYSPIYEHPADNSSRKDLRSTIYWKPEIVTDKDGNASFDYYNADGMGTYKVVVEGIDENGNLGRMVYRYKVE